MKKIFDLIICVLLVFVLISCEEGHAEEPYFPEGFVEVEDYIMPFQTFFAATKGIESEYRKRNKAALEFYADPEYLPNVNPYDGTSVNLYSEYVDNYEVDFSSGTFPTKYFKSEKGYKCYCNWMMDLEFFLGAVENSETKKLDLRFFRYKGGIGPGDGAYVPGFIEYDFTFKLNVVEYNGFYSYFFTGSLDCLPHQMKNLAHLFYLFYVTEDLPYDVYYTNSNFILLNKSDEFSKACLNEFIKSKEVHYFDRSKIDKFWKNNQDLYPLDWFE